LTVETMSNVVCLRADRRARAPAGLPPPHIEDADAFRYARIIGLQSKAKEEILRSIFLLELAAQHARQVAKRLDDPALNNNLGAQVAIVEQLLQIARGMALRL
jgi:hypothetical protein